MSGTTISGSDVVLKDPEQQAVAIRADEAGAFREAMERELNGALAAWSDELAKHYWGDVPPSNYPAPKITAWMRIRWRWRAMRQGLARAALWLLRVDARELCDCDY